MVKEFSLSSGAPVKLLKEGLQEARIGRILDLGVQPENPNSKFKKGPQRRLLFMFELSEDKVSVDGTELPAVAMWEINFVGGEKSKLTKLLRLLGFDLSKNAVDLTRLIGKAVTVNIEHYVGQDQVKRSKVGDVSGVSAKVEPTIPALTMDSYYFDYDDPDPAVVSKLSDHMLKKLRASVLFKGSKLEKLVGSPEEKRNDVI